jgi:riboflavin biosynthesis pyrimidine reductase
MSAIRLLLPGNAEVGRLDPDSSPSEDVLQALADLYAYPVPVRESGWVRASMVSTLDGSASGADGRSGSVNTVADRVVFGVLRGLADAVLVGAGTARAEGYRQPVAKPVFADRRFAAGQTTEPVLAIVTRSGRLPDQALFGPPNPSLVITCEAADLAALRRTAGRDRVLVAGEQDVDPVLAVAGLAALGLPRILLEGGPTLLGRVVAAGRLDELCLTWSPTLAGGEGPRISHGPAADLRLRPAHLAECGGTLLGRWLVQR